MNSTQTNTIERDIVAVASEALAAGRLCKLANSAGSPVATLPTAVGDLAFFLVIDAAAAAADPVTLRPIANGRSVRVTLKNTCIPGDVLVLADPSTAADKGKVRSLTGLGSSTYRGLGIAEESGVDGQLVLMRPVSLGNITT